MILVPIYFCALGAVVLVHTLLIVLKLSLRVFIVFLGTVVYSLWPFDIIPDVLIGLGQIDDLLVFFGLMLWAIKAGVSKQLRIAITVNRPTTQFP
jgi:uncharacterized membrane protein YkvA (DUF1232 family)